MENKNRSVSDAVIRVRGLKKDFDNLSVLKGIDVDICKGDVVCVIGASGSGKSTFLRCLNMLEKPTGGKIIFDGEDLAAPKANLNLHRQKMGMVFQHFNLFPHKTVLENITLAPLLMKQDTPDAIRTKALNLLEQVGLSQKKDSYPWQLSGGMRQRVALIRTLAVRPDILLLDEPFSALDYQTRLLVTDDVRKILCKEKMTTLMVSHDIPESISMADRIVVLADGQVQQDGARKDILPTLLGGTGTMCSALTDKIR